MCLLLPDSDRRVAGSRSGVSSVRRHEWRLRIGPASGSRLPVIWRCLVRLVLVTLCVAFTAPAQARGSGGHSSSRGSVYVHGYTRSNGTYVAPHYRSAPDGNFWNNWSTVGNVNPYTGKPGTKSTPPTRIGSVPAGTAVLPALPGSSGSLPSLIGPAEPQLESATRADSPLQTYGSHPPPVSAYAISRATADVARARYWKERGYEFDPRYMSAYAMDRKVADIQRAQFWSSQGYNFDPQYMTAYAMDRKVEDIRRATYWRGRGYQFNPNYLTAYAMDRKVEDINRATYWKERGFDFDPNYMTAYAMDRKVEDIRRAQYWRERGFEFDPQYMNAYAMDAAVARRRAGR